MPSKKKNNIFNVLLGRKIVFPITAVILLLWFVVIHSKGFEVGAYTLNELYVGATETPSFTPTPVSSVGPTSTPKNCQAFCWNDADCGGSLHCYYGYCRNPNCLTETDCDCSAFTPTPTASPSAFPSALPVAPPEIILFLPEEEVVIYGYAPANSTVKLFGIQVASSTQAESDGFFIFRGLSLPTTTSYLMGNLYPELCLQAIDDEKRTTQPVCIPPLSLKSGSRKTGPVILPPTISLEKGSFTQGEQTKASGMTTPNTEVEVYFSRSSSPNFLKIVKEVWAYNIPIYQTVSNNNGYFEFNLPSDSPEDWKVFAASKTLGASSPKSNTLSFKVRPNFLQFLLYLFALLKKYLIYIVIIIQLLIIYLLYKHLTKGKRRKKNDKK
jgi:hypothetical protein